MAGVFLSVAFVCFVTSMSRTTVANTLFLLSAAPLLAAFLGWLLLRESVRKTTWAAMVAAVFGVAIMVGDGLAQGDTLGDLLGLGAALSFALFTVTLRRKPGVDMLLCIALGVVQMGCGLMAYIIGARHLGAAESALLSMSEVVLGPLWVWWVFSEVPATLTLGGGAIVLAALVGNALSGLRRRRPPLGTV